MKDVTYYDKSVSKTFNQLAREQMKHKLLADIRMDMEICKIENWSVMEYILDIKMMLDEIVEKYEK